MCCKDDAGVQWQTQEQCEWDPAGTTYRSGHRHHPSPWIPPLPSTAQLSYVHPLLEHLS